MRRKILKGSSIAEFKKFEAKKMKKSEDYMSSSKSSELLEIKLTNRRVNN